MPQLLFSLEWDSREIRVMAASGRGRQVVIEHAFSVPCEVDASAGDTAEQIGKRIAAELDVRGLGRGEAVVAVGRNSIELRQLQMPPAPDDDLPDMVRFQASREFNELDDKWLLDFVPIDGSAETPRTVLATAIAPAVLKQIEAVCEHSGLKMRRLLLRPCETALLLEGEKSIPRGQVVLLVDPLGLEADLTAVVDGTAVFLRTTRFSSDPPPVPALVSEIRRTMAAASNQLGGRRIESILLCGDQPANRDLARTIETETDLRVELFDPFSGATLGRELAVRPPENPGRFAPLVGMLLAELKPSRHAVDFLHPRRRPAPPDRRKKWIIAGAAAAVLFLGWVIYCKVSHYLLASEVAGLDADSKSMDKQIDDEKKLSANMADIQKWVDEDANWLDRVYELNQCVPSAENTMLNELTATSGQHGGQIDLKGFIRQQSDLTSLGNSLRSHDDGRLSIKNSHEDRVTRPYNRIFEASILPQPPKGEKP
jgi:Tfp pilus assembly PilM family ATPase